MTTSSTHPNNISDNSPKSTLHVDVNLHYSGLKSTLRIDANIGLPQIKAVRVVEEMVQTLAETRVEP